MERLFEYAASISVTIGFKPGLNPSHPGTYCHALKHIDVLDGMSRVKTLSVIAHELGHAALGHEPTMFAYLDARQERAADEWAAHFLIDHREYKIAEEKFGTNTAWIAQELCVLERLVTAYERSLDRIGNTVYVNAKLGHATARFEVA